jgi:hypothetical protein
MEAHASKISFMLMRNYMSLKKCVFKAVDAKFFIEEVERFHQGIHQALFFELNGVVFLFSRIPGNLLLWFKKMLLLFGKHGSKSKLTVPIPIAFGEEKLKMLRTMFQGLHTTTFPGFSGNGFHCIYQVPHNLSLDGYMYA